MDVFQLRQGRYLLYLDILGFKQIVRTRSTREVYEIVDRVLAEFRLRESRIREFRTLYFSDTIIFYQDPVGWGSWAFADVYAIAGMAWSALAAHDIPCRGAISFGEFFVELDSNEQHSIFFGEALIDAYETESHESNSEWIGITLCPSAWQAVEYADSGLIDVLTGEGRFLKVGDCLRLNPFMKLPAWFVDYQIGEIQDAELPTWDAPDFPNDVKALDFILGIADQLHESPDSSQRISAKYHATSAIYTQLLGKDCVEWARGIAPSMREVSEGH